MRPGAHEVTLRRRLALEIRGFSLDDLTSSDVKATTLAQGYQEFRTQRFPTWLKLVHTVRTDFT